MYRIPVCNPYGSPNGYYSTHLFHAQCKRVCKSWRNFICQTPDFIVNFMRNTPVKTLLLNSADDVVLLTPKHGEFVKTPIMKTNNTNNRKSSSDDERLSIIGSCHGLICVLQKARIKNREQIYLLNLISADRIFDPLSNHVYRRNWKKETVYQFGFIPSANKFKLLRFVFNTRDNLYSNLDSLAIFTVGEDDDWRPLPTDLVSIFPSDIFRLSSFVTFNGVVHWINHGLGVISTFDLGQEKGGRISLPNMVEDFDMKKKFEIKVLKDCLSLVEYPDESESDTESEIIETESESESDTESESEIPMLIEDEIITIWMMKEYPIEESWRKEYVISMKPDSGISLDLYLPVSPFGPLDVVTILPTGDILLSSKYLKEDPICYNPREKKWKLFRDVYGVSMRGYKISGVPISNLNPNLLLEG